jgi:DNA-binding CsgD family transcriptional regulator
MAMNADRIERLTDKQRECLRMVYRHMETKEIARVLGLSPDGVTQRIKTAMKTLGVDRRRDAARILAEAEGIAPYPRQVYMSRDIASPPEPVMLAPSTESGWQGSLSGGAMREEQAVFKAASSFRPRGLQLPLPIRGGTPNDLNSWHRLGWILAVMLTIAFMFGVFLAGLEALSRLGRLIAS